MIEQSENVTSVNRPNLSACYLNRMTDYLVRTYGISAENAARFIKGIMQSRYQARQVTYVKTVGPGRTQIVKSDLNKFIRELHDKVIAPSGSVYYPTSVKPSPVSEFLNYKKKQRSKVKKEQLKAIARGDSREANRLWYLQASIKISMNSLPGAYASLYSIFYDKGGYNTITSTGRAQISRSSATVEMFLGGMLSFFSEGELINFILINLQYRPSDEEITHAMGKYNLKQVNAESLYRYYQVHFSRYTKEKDYLMARDLIFRLSPIEINFLFYYCNLRNILQFNEEVFKPRIRDMLNPDNYPPIDGTVDDMYKFDDPTRTLVSVAFAERLNKQSTETIAKEHKELIPVFIGLARGIKKRVNELKELLTTFCWTYADIPNVKAKQMATRNTVILQDTDSNLYSGVQWAEWYAGHKKFNVDSESLAINALMGYLLHITVEFAMWRFSSKMGCTAPHMKTISMKGEFNFSIVVLFEIKKIYANLIVCREGTMLPKLTPDIKGALLRGSSKSEEVNQFTEDLIVNKILIPATNGKISAYDLIDTVVNFELKLKASMERGEMTFLNSDSIRLDKDYKNPEQTPIVLAYRFWEDLMSKKYGDITRPTKCSSFPCLYPDTAYMDWAKKHYPKFQAKLEEWLKSHKYPSKLIINPSIDRVPPMLIPLIDVKKIIYQDCQGAYYTLRRLNISTGHPKLKIRFSEIYGKPELTS